MTIEDKGFDKAVWDSNNEFTAMASGNTIQTYKVGRATLTSEFGSIEVLVKPKYYLYEEPYMKFGCTKDELISICGTPTEEDGDILVYEDAYNSTAPLVLYLFEDNKYTSSAVIVLSTFVKLCNFFEKRHEMLEADKKNQLVAFTHHYGKKANPQIEFARESISMAELFGEDSHMVEYNPYTEMAETASRSITLNNIEKTVFVEKAKELLK